MQSHFLTVSKSCSTSSSIVSSILRNFPKKRCCWRGLGGSSFGEADPKCFPSPRCSLHPSRMTLWRSSRWESSPEEHYQDSLVLIQLSGLLHKGRKLPLNNRIARKRVRWNPRSDNWYSCTQEGELVWSSLWGRQCKCFWSYGWGQGERYPPASSLVPATGRRQDRILREEQKEFPGHCWGS